MTAYTDAVTRLDQTPLNPYYNLSPYEVTTNPGGMAGYGHRIAFFDLVADLLTVGEETVNKSADAVAAAATAATAASSAINAPGTKASSTTSLTVGAGAKALTLAETGKAFAIGQTVKLARTSNPAAVNMWGDISAFNAGTGDMTVQVAAGSFKGAGGPYTDWTISLAASGDAVPNTRQVTGGGMATGGGPLSADQTITVTAAAAAAVRTGTTKAQVMTPGDTYDALAEVTLTDAATIAVDLGAMINGVVTLGGARTLGNPTNAKPGQTGRIRVVQDGAGGRTLAFASNWKREGGAPTASAAAGAEDYIDFDVVTSSKIRYNYSKSPS